MNEEEIKIKYGITDKQYKFANYYLAGDIPTDAYRKAYETQADSKSVSSQSGRVLRNPKVAAYIRDMQKIAYDKSIAENKNIMSTQDVLEWLSKVVKSDSRSIKMCDRMKACDMLLKAGGAYVQKVEADIRSVTDIVINITDDEEDDIDAD